MRRNSNVNIKSRGYLVPIVLMIAGLASSVMALDMHRFRAENQAQILRIHKKALLLALEMESLILSQTLEQQLRELCILSDLSNCSLPVQQSITPLHILGQPAQVAISFIPCTDAVGIACEAGSNNLGFIQGRVNADTLTGVTLPQLGFERYAYIALVVTPGATEAIRLERSQLLEGL